METFPITQIFLKRFLDTENTKVVRFAFWTTLPFSFISSPSRVHHTNDQLPFWQTGNAASTPDEVSLDSIFNEVLWGAVSLIKVLLCPARTPSHLDTNCLMMGNNYYPCPLNFYSCLKKLILPKGWGISGPFCNSLQPANRSVLESCLFDWDEEDHRRAQPENWGHTCLCQGRSFSKPSPETFLVMPGPGGRAAGWHSGCCQGELSWLPPPCFQSLWLL